MAKALDKLRAKEDRRPEILLQDLAELVPIRFAFGGHASALSRGPGWSDHVVVLLSFGSLALPLSLWLFGRALALTQARGSLKY